VLREQKEREREREREREEDKKVYVQYVRGNDFLYMFYLIAVYI